MKVLMFGWEFPPFNTGGLGTACYGITKGLSNKGVDVIFVLPNAPQGAKGEHVKLVVADKSVKIKRINSPISAYMTNEEYLKIKTNKDKGSQYGQDLFLEVQRYAALAGEIAKEEEFDVIHAHDWLTYLAGLEAKKVSGKPLVVHMHATEFDRTGGNGVNQYVYDIERKGMHEADIVIPVSNYTKNMIMKHYGVPENKIHVVHNAVEFTNYDGGSVSGLNDHSKIVLFLGRITLQKGPDYFIDAARKVLDIYPDVKFIVAGSGDMEPAMIEKAASLGMCEHVLFAGFLRGEDIDRAYKMADVYVMPSVSEPFGITPLEAMRNGTPVIISKQSGVSEVITHCIKIDFWDINQMADKILGVLRFKELHGEMSDMGGREVMKFNWDIPAEKCVDVYNKVVR